MKFEDLTPNRQPNSRSPSRTPTALSVQHQAIHALYSLPVRDLHAETNTETELVSPCPICQCEAVSPTFGLENQRERIVTCHGCGLGRMLPLPDAARLASFYPSDYYGTQGSKFEPLTELLVRLLSWRRARFLARGLPPDARVLDIGCGRGTILNALANRGFEAHGVERDLEAAIGLNARVRLQVVDRLADAQYADSHFHLVVLWHVLEHMSDIRETLCEIHRVLTAGGKLVVAVPNWSSRQASWAGADWFHLDPPRHLFHFPAQALRQLLQDCGFAIQSEHHFSLRHNPFGWVQSWLNRIEYLPRNGLYVLLQKTSGTRPFTWKLRCLLRMTYYLAMPWALLLSIRDAILRSGATVHFVAERTGDGSPVRGRGKTAP